jgi:hypothetical protein
MGALPRDRRAVCSTHIGTGLTSIVPMVMALAVDSVVAGGVASLGRPERRVLTRDVDLPAQRGQAVAEAAVDPGL